MTKKQFLKNVLPSFLVKNEQEFRKKFEIIRKKVRKPYLHIDVMDGTLTWSSCWAEPEIIRKIVGKTPFEVHLMVNNPYKYTEKWQKAGARRIHVHAEIRHNLEKILASIRINEIEAGLALNASTPLSKLKNLAPDAILLMGITAGASGKPFQKKVFSKIRSARKLYCTLPLIIDGGVTLKNMPLLLECGATHVVSASALYKLLGKHV
ncbi:hypothetical protein HY620_01025 [Candidatus Uhrbacteria bacterium]|nr:hypothetical protein [Candidatus Uhrbacteria bacterium]